MRSSHPYEEIAYDLLPLANQVTRFGYGVVGLLPSPATTTQIARRAASALASDLCQVAGDPGRVHRRVAAVGGSGGSFIGDALRSGATLFITADIRYHDAQEAVARGLDLVILDHYATERPVLDGVRVALERKLPGVAVRVAEARSSPYVSIEK